MSDFKSTVLAVAIGAVFSLLAGPWVAKWLVDYGMWVAGL